MLLIPLLHGFFRFAVAERTGTIILSALIAHTGWHWMLDRGERLRQFRFTRPVLTAAVLASAMRFLMVTLILAGLVWCVAKYWPLKFPARQPSPRGRLGIGSTQVGTVGNSLETETGGEI
ncbi:MAG: hypothetical protein DMG31_05695 [Acidobacteria bacterium]|nr:MAG: hypothetical protein DMG31_05695 [Acidobacteriota bacterium]